MKARILEITYQGGRTEFILQKRTWLGWDYVYGYMHRDRAIEGRERLLKGADPTNYYNYPDTPGLRIACVNHWKNPSYYEVQRKGFFGWKGCYESKKYHERIEDAIKEMNEIYANQLKSIKEIK